MSDKERFDQWSAPCYRFTIRIRCCILVLWWTLTKRFHKERRTTEVSITEKPSLLRVRGRLRLFDGSHPPILYSRYIIALKMKKNISHYIEDISQVAVPKYKYAQRRRSPISMAPARRRSLSTAQKQFLPTNCITRSTALSETTALDSISCFQLPPPSSSASLKSTRQMLVAGDLLGISTECVWRRTYPFQSSVEIRYSGISRTSPSISLRIEARLD